MRLINTETGEFFNCVDLETTPPYAILSHTWDKDGEQTYQEVVKVQEKYGLHPPRKQLALPNPNSDEPSAIAEVPTPSEIDTSSRPTPSRPESPSDVQTPPASPPTTHPSIWDPDSGLSEKVRKACEVARGDGYLYIWVDSSCIDKSSSSELSEAINSMYDWYRAAHICYAFLVDVPSDVNVRAWDSKFRESRWFKRCWTLQELIAPRVVVFLSQHWEYIGTKDKLSKIVERITSINYRILTREMALSGESIVDRMRWAANREATRVEDKAYSLLGIFGITMPTLYGEGEYAFRRFQEEILRRIPDQSLFAWGDKRVPFPLEPCNINLSMRDSSSKTLLAPSPSSFGLNELEVFSTSRTIRATGDSIKSLGLPVEEYTPTPYGIRTQLRLLPLHALNPELEIHSRNDESDPGTWYLALLSCHPEYDQKWLLSRICCLRNHSPNVEFLLVPDNIKVKAASSAFITNGSVIFTVSLANLTESSSHLQIKTVYLPHPKPAVTARRQQLKGPHKTLNLTLPMWVQSALRMRGYLIQGPAEDNGNSFSFSLVYAPFNIHIHYRHITYPPSEYAQSGDAVMIQARVWLLTPDEEAHRTDAAILCSPPYTSVTWADNEPWVFSFPVKSLDLVADCGEQATLKLRLDLISLSRYNIYVDVSTSTGPTYVGAASHRSDSEGNLDSGDDSLNSLLFKSFRAVPHETFNTILTGFVRRTLEMKGYSPRLALDPRLGGFRTHSLTLSRDADSFAIVVKYFCTLVNVTSISQALVVVARVTLESLIPDDEAVQDGPHVVLWKDDEPWRRSLMDKHVVLATPTGESFTLLLGFDFAWQSEYHLRVDIEPRSRQPAWYNRHIDFSYTLPLPHGSVDLTLPGHVRHALQDQGYQVRFEELDTGGGGESSDPVRHLLTFSHITAGITIVIEYSHYLQVVMDSREPKTNRDLREPDIDYPFLLAEPHPGSGLSAPVDEVRWTRCQQELIFRASARVLPLRGDTGSLVIVQDDVATATVDWNTKYRYDHPRGKEHDSWRWHLPNKDIILTLPTGNELVLRLGFYYVWNGEYCLMVQINPREPLSRTQSRDEGPPMPDYELDESGMEYIRQALAQSTEPAHRQSTDALDDDSEPLPADLSILQSSQFSSGEPESAGDSVLGKRSREESVAEAQGDTVQPSTPAAIRSETDLGAKRRRL